MRLATILIAGLVFVSMSSQFATKGEPRLDSRVVQITLPVADVELSYIESNPHMTVELTAGTTTIEGVRFFVGNGKIAVPLEADVQHGIRFQQTQRLHHGHKFAKYSSIELEDGYKTVDDLKPGDVYIVFPAVNFNPKKN
jgi:hypothetical protein